MKHSLVFWAMGGILLTLAAEQFTDWDILISNAFFNADERSWLISYERHLRLSPLFYSGMKIFVSAVGSIAAVITAASYGYSFLKPYRQGALALVLGTIIIPSAVAFLKDITQIYCPNQLAIYSGIAPYIHLFERYPAWFHSVHPPRCFPAGHPTGAFALMSLYYVFQTPRGKRNGLLFGFFLGCIASGYQMLRGEHFLSHSLISFFLAAALLPLIYRLAGQVLRLAASLVRRSKSTFSAAE